MRKFYKTLSILLMFIGFSAYSQFPAPYCNVTFTSGVEPITLVNFAGINNATVATIGGPALENFTAMVGNVNAGATYPITLNGNTDGPYTVYFRVFIDWNQNNDFTDPGESYDIGTTTGNNGFGPPVVGSIGVPTIALGGNTRMRVMKRYNVFSADGCQTGPGYGQAEDYTLSVTAAPACDGAPVVGTATASVASTCSGVAFTLNAAVTPAPGLTYQWESSVDQGNTWVAMGTAQTQPGYTVTSQSVPTFYRVVVVCAASSSSTASASVAVEQSPAADCYCMNAFPYNCTDGDLVLNVSFASINNPSGCSASGYINYAGVVETPVVTAGSTLPISVTVGPSGDGWVYESAGVWIDYNQNGVFEESEYTYIGTGLDEVLTADVVIPVGALEGITKMRVVASATTEEGFNATFACGPVSATSNYGEMEDYEISIQPQLATPGFDASGFSMYPNPTSGLVNFKFGASTTVHAVSVYSTSGRLVHSRLGNNVASESFELNLQGVSSGVYIVKIETADGTLNKRLIKE